MENVKISDREAMEQIRAILDRTHSGSPLAAAVRRVFADLLSVDTDESENIPATASAAPDRALRSVRLPESTVRQWEAEAQNESPNASAE